eukprot:7899650-Heterocapsa_arctica.AAC.1
MAKPLSAAVADHHLRLCLAYLLSRRLRASEDKAQGGSKIDLTSASLLTRLRAERAALRCPSLTSHGQVADT